MIFESINQPGRLSLATLKVATYRHMYRAEPKEPTQFGSVSGSEIQSLPVSHSGIVSLYQSEPKEPTYFGSVSGSEIQNICIGPNLEKRSRRPARLNFAFSLIVFCGHSQSEVVYDALGNIYPRFKKSSG